MHALNSNRNIPAFCSVVMFEKLRFFRAPSGARLEFRSGLQFSWRYSFLTTYLWLHVPSSIKHLGRDDKGKIGSNQPKDPVKSGTHVCGTTSAPRDLSWAWDSMVGFDTLNVPATGTLSR